jgi:hypothetical protein
MINPPLLHVWYENEGKGNKEDIASKQMATWDWSAVNETAEKVGAECHVVPKGGQHYNGQVVRLIGLLKKCLQITMAKCRFTLGELSTVVV